MGAEAVRHELETLERLLAQHGESGPAQMSRAALDGNDQKLRACLASNELWGGAGAAQKVIQSVARNETANVSRKRCGWQFAPPDASTSATRAFLDKPNDTPGLRIHTPVARRSIETKESASSVASPTCCRTPTLLRPFLRLSLVAYVRTSLLTHAAPTRDPFATRATLAASRQALRWWIERPLRRRTSQDLELRSPRPTPRQSVRPTGSRRCQL